MQQESIYRHYSVLVSPSFLPLYPPPFMESTVLPATPTTTNNTKSNTCGSLSKSKSSSTTSTVDDDHHYNINSISSIYSLSSPPCDKRSSMDELWKDINLASLHDHPSTAFRDGQTPTLQDFLTSPVQTDHPASRNPSVAGSEDAAACSCYHRPPAFTLLSLSSGSGGHHIGNREGDPARRGYGVKAPSPYFVKTLGSAYDPGLYKRKAAALNDGEDRGKRLMKNRESASRSRAKKHVLPFTLHPLITSYCFLPCLETGKQVH